MLDLFDYEPKLCYTGRQILPGHKNWRDSDQDYQITQNDYLNI